MEVQQLTSGRLPDFFIVGHAKCGTTALYQALRRHPDIFMPDVKEPLFFASDMGRRPAHLDRLPKTLAEYRQLFAEARDNQRAGEASALYLYSDVAAHSIAEVAPHARIIAIFREPAAFLFSFHQQARRDHLENRRSLRRALAIEHHRREGRRIPRGCFRPRILHYSNLVRYTDQLQRYCSAFPRENVLTIIYDDFRQDSASTLQRITEFLEVDSSYPLQADEAHGSVTVRSQALDELVHRVSVGMGPLSRGAKTAIQAVVPQRSRRRAEVMTRSKIVYGKPGSLDPGFMAELRTWLKPEVVRFGSYIGRDLVKLWGYDSV